MREYGPDPAFFLHYWTLTIFLPAVLLLIIVMVLLTRWRDGRDAAAVRQEGAPGPPQLGDDEVGKA